MEIKIATFMAFNCGNYIATSKAKGPLILEISGEK
jgi:hypothetical protein